MKIAFLVGEFPKLSETFIMNQIIGLLRNEHHVDIYAIRRPKSDLTHERVTENELTERTVYIENNKNIRYLAWRARQIISECLSNPRLFSNAAQEGFEAISDRYAYKGYSPELKDRIERYDAIHAHFGPIGNGFLFLADKNTPYITSFYGYDASSLIDQNPKRYDELFQKSDTITVLSRHMENQIQNVGCPGEKIKKVPLTIDTEQFTFQERNVSQDQITILTVARLVEKKGIKYAIKAIAKVMEETEINIEYNIVGGGPLAEQLRAQVQARDLEESVSLLGWQEQDTVLRHLYKSDLFLLPSVTAENGDQEGTPTVLLEAQATGLPIVSTTHAGIPEIVSDGSSGYLVPERDVGELAQSIISLVKDSDRYKKFSQNGRELIEENHSIPTVTAQLEQIYNTS
jgi:colanic acid/amylovoran biosynthesis glycosyltransferase